MAELTAEQLKALMGNQAGVESKRSQMEEFRQQDIPAIIHKLGDISAEIRELIKTNLSIAINMVAEQEKGKTTDGDGTSKAQIGEDPLDSISSHLKDIKDFLVKTFKEGPKSNFKDKQINPPDTNDSVTEKLGESMDEGSKTALGWLGGLFAVGALGELSKVLGIGAAGGAAGLLAKVAGKIFKFTGPVLRRIPIIGSLFSFYEAYKKIKAGGIDNTIFGLMDIAAGIFYMVPGIGTGIGIGIDVLQYFLKGKADEFKKENPDVSFFGSLYDKLIDYLSETPIIKWMVGIGDKFSALWNDPSVDTFLDLFEHLGSYFQVVYSTFKMLSDDAGSALGLTDASGNSQGLFEWLYKKVDDYVLTPVKNMFTSVFDYVAGIIKSVQDSLGDMILSIVDKLPNIMGARDTIKAALGLNTTTDPDPGGEKNKLREEIKGKLSDVYKGDEDAADAAMQKANTSSLPELKQQLKEMDNQLLKDATPINQPEKFPTSQEIDREIMNKAFGGAPNQSTVNQTQVNTYVAPSAPSRSYRGYGARRKR
mgnify:CR=1 FL=1